MLYMHKRRRARNSPSSRQSPAGLRQAAADRFCPDHPAHDAAAQNARRQHRAEQRGRACGCKRMPARAERQSCCQRRASPQTASYRSHEEQRQKRPSPAPRRTATRVNTSTTRYARTACRASDAPVAAQRFSNSRFAADVHAQPPRRCSARRSSTLPTYTALAPPSSISAKGYENDIRIEDRRHPAVTVVSKAAHAHGKLPAFQAVRQVVQPRHDDTRRRDRSAERRFERRGALPSSTARRDKQRRRHVFRRVSLPVPTSSPYSTLAPTAKNSSVNASS